MEWDWKRHIPAHLYFWRLAAWLSTSRGPVLKHNSKTERFRRTSDGLIIRAQMLSLQGKATDNNDDGDDRYRNNCWTISLETAKIFMRYALRKQINQFNDIWRLISRPYVRRADEKPAPNKSKCKTTDADSKLQRKQDGQLYRRVAHRECASNIALSYGAKGSSVLNRLGAWITSYNY